MGPLSFVLLDVDLYRPMKKALPELYDALSPQGIMVVDDCDAGNVRWDGSAQAYKEFMSERGLPPTIVHGKLGILRKGLVESKSLFELASPRGFEPRSQP